MSGLLSLLTHPDVGIRAPCSKMASYRDMLDRVIKKRAELLAEASRLEQVILALRSAEKILQDESPDKVAALQSDLRLEEDQPLAQRELGLVPPSDVARLARKIIIDNGRPLKRGALVRALEAKGVPMSGSDKSKNLGTILWRHKNQFVNIAKLGYWPRDMRFRNIYDPANPPDGINYVDPDAL